MKEIALIGAADSIGVPYSRDNKKHDGFFEMIEEELSEKYNVTSINCFHMSTYNDNKYISSLIKSNKSLEEIKNSRNLMLRKCKYSGIYPFMELPKTYLNHYEIYPNDKNILLTDTIKNNKTIFIYSAFANDILKAKKLSLFKLLRPGKIKEELKDLDISFVLNDIEKNIEGLIALNSNIEIYIIGLFIPTKIKYIRKNLKDFIICVNNLLKTLSVKYKNVHFVDNSNLEKEDFNNIDFHPNLNGHIKICENFNKVFKSK